MGLNILYIMLYLIHIDNKIYKMFICMTLPLPIYFYNPIDVYKYNLTGYGGYSDAYRIFNEMDLFRCWGWDSVTTYDGAIFSKIYIYFFSLLNNNNILLSFNVFIVYFLALYIIGKMKKYFISNDKVERFLILYLIIFSNYFIIATNIRQQLALTICFVILFFDLLEKRYFYRCLLGYVVVILLHPSLLVIVLLRMATVLSYKKILMAAIVFFGGCYMYLDLIINILINSNIDFLSELAAKQIGYSGYEIFRVNPPFKIAIGIVDINMIVSSFLLIKYLKVEILYKYNRLIKLTMILGIMGLITIALDAQFLGRIEFLGIYLLLIYIYIYIYKQNFKINEKKYIKILSFNKLLLVLMLMYAIYFNIINAMKAFCY